MNLNVTSNYGSEEVVEATGASIVSPDSAEDAEDEEEEEEEEE